MTAQQRKKQLAPDFKALCNHYGVKKYSIRLNYYAQGGTAIMTVWKANFNLLGKNDQNGYREYWNTDRSVEVLDNKAKNFIKEAFKLLDKFDCISVISAGNDLKPFVNTTEVLGYEKI